MRCLLLILAVLCSQSVVVAEQPKPQTQLVLATVRLSNASSAATGFVLIRSRGEGEKPQYLLVTAAHVFERAKGEELQVGFRRRIADQDWQKELHTIKVRAGDKPLWTQHEKHDVAVIAIEPPPGAELPALSVDLLATEETLGQLEPGDFVRTACYPHAAVYEPNEAGFPLMRLGCISSYPLVPLAKNPNFLVDYSTFEGDSGGPVFWVENNPSNESPRLAILGLIHGQRFFNQSYQLVYERGEMRKQLGLAIVIPAAFIRETIDQLP
jgi:hypothetical protein